MDTQLQPFSKSDFKELISWIHSPEEMFTWSATTFTFPLDEDQLEKHYQAALGPNPRLMYTAVDCETKEPAGHIELVRIDRVAGKASLACVLVAPHKRGRGYGQGMIENILNECFLQMKLLRVDLFVFDFNTIAINCYRKAGFEIEKVVPDQVQFNGQFITMFLMGLEYEKWLASK